MSRDQTDRQQSDHDLAARLHSGDERAFRTLFDRFWPLLFQFASRMLGDDDAAMDATQEAFITVWEKRESIRTDSSLKGYLYTIAKNKLLIAIRRSKVANQYLAELRHVYEEGVSDSEERVLEKEIAARFESELASLPPKMREAFELSRLEEKSYREIAETMDISDSTVKQHISKALKILRDKLASWILF